MSISYISGNGLYSITNWNVDINNTPGIPAGTYRLGFFVDSNNDISESDENNNAGLLAGNINYTPSASGIAVNSVFGNSISLLPNPSGDQSKINFTLTGNSKVEINIYDMTGQLVKVIADEEMPAGDHSVIMETGSIPSGVYFVSLVSGESSVTRRLTVQH
jgi:hypothetical protein